MNDDQAVGLQEAYLLRCQALGFDPLAILPDGSLRYAVDDDYTITDHLTGAWYAVYDDAYRDAMAHRQDADVAE